MISPLAIPANAFGRRMFDGRGKRSTPVYGVMIHTTGSALPKRMTKTPEATLSEAVRLYTGNGAPHYVVGWDGKIVATVASEAIRGAHAGISEQYIRDAYHRGGWESQVSKEGARLWHEKWPGRRTPLDLVPTRNLSNINDLWIGIEMIPITAGDGKYWAKPAHKGARFTKEQHAAVRALVHDIAKRHKLPSGWSKKGSARLLGHSDVDPIDRDSPAQPLWDPGDSIGFFDMDFVRSGGYGWLMAGAGALGLGFYLSRYMR